MPFRNLPRARSLAGRSASPHALISREVITVDGVQVSVLRKKNRNMYLRVKPPYGAVEVTAPARMPQQDIVRFVRERLLPPYGALPVTVLGDSAGGYYACCLGCTAIVNRTGTDVKRAEYVVDLNGITDLTGKWKYGLSAAHAALAEAYSPRYNVSADDAPVLIVHGDRDATVALSDAQAYLAALKSAGADVTMRVLADTAHAFILFDYRHDNAYVAKVLADLADHLAARGLI